MKTIQRIAEFFTNRIERIRNRNKKPTFLALSVIIFTEEYWIDGIFRQGRLKDYLYE